MTKRQRRSSVTDHFTPRNLLLGLGAFGGGIAALAVGAVALGRRQAGQGGAFGQHDPAPRPATTAADNGPTPHDEPAPTGLEGHAAPDLAADADPHQRAPEAFRPDIDAPMTPAEREALRPATGPSPSLVNDEGGSVQGVGGDRY